MKTFKQLLEQIDETLSLFVEEVETLDELSKSTMGAYAKKAAADFTARKPKMGYDGQLKKMQNRKVGVNRALDKMYGEEVEQIDELSRKTLSSYTASAARDMAHTARKHSDAQNAAADVNASLKKAKKKNNYDSPAHKQGEKLGHRWMNRAKGIDKATNRLAKEEVDLEEGRMKDLAMDMESLSHADFKKKHKRTKQEMQSSLKSEALKGDQHKIDANKNGKVDGHDFKILRNQKKARYQ
jgi:hypothetical protein